MVVGAGGKLALFCSCVLLSLVQRPHIWGALVRKHLLVVLCFTAFRSPRSPCQSVFTDSGVVSFLHVTEAPVAVCGKNSRGQDFSRATGASSGSPTARLAFSKRPISPDSRSPPLSAGLGSTYRSVLGQESCRRRLPRLTLRLGSGSSLVGEWQTWFASLESAQDHLRHHCGSRSRGKPFPAAHPPGVRGFSSKCPGRFYRLLFTHRKRDDSVGAPLTTQGQSQSPAHLEFKVSVAHTRD